ncbi:MAG: HAMP domain-containing sensor histidine kinase [Promethearchaeia archaeon]
MTKDYPENIIKRYKIILIGFFFSIIYWLLDSCLDFFIFRPSASFYANLSFPSLHDLWMRLYGISFILAFSIIANYFYSRDRRVKQQLKQSEKKYWELFNNIRSGVAIYEAIDNGKDFKFVEINKFGEKLGEVKREEVLGKPVTKIFPGIKNFGLMKVFQRVWKTGKPEYYPPKLYKDNNIEGWRDNYVYKLPSGEIVAVYEDITREKENTQYLKQSYNKINFYKDLLSHNMGNILNNMKTSIQLMEMREKSPSRKYKKEDLLEILREQVELGSSLISDVRNLTSLEKQMIRPESLDIKPLIESSIDYIKKFFRRRSINLQTTYPQKLNQIRGTDLLNKAFENILMNAVIHNKRERVKIWINIEKIEKKGKAFVKIEFKDNGVGITDDRKKHIFQENYQEANKKGGMGIGLSLVKEIIDECGGKIWVENRIKGDHTQGSNFIILLKVD